MTFFAITKVLQEADAITATELGDIKGRLPPVRPDDSIVGWIPGDIQRLYYLLLKKAIELRQLKYEPSASREKITHLTAECLALDSLLLFECFKHFTHKLPVPPFAFDIVRDWKMVKRCAPDTSAEDFEEGSTNEISFVCDSIKLLLDATFAN